MRRRRNALCVCLLLIVSALVAGSGAVAETDETEETLTTPIVILEGYYVDILDAYAVTEVTRVMRNPTDEPMNHTFVFRVPEGALISNFSIVVDEVTYYADVLEKEEAEEAYQEAVSSGSSAGLVASKGDEVFEYKVSFAPEETMKATIRYEQVLLKQKGWHEYLLPFEADADAEPVGWFEVIVDITAPRDITKFQSIGYEDDCERMAKGPMGHWDVRLKDHTPDENVTIRWMTGRSPPDGTMYYGEHNGSGYFLHVFDPDPSIFGEARMGKDFVFILDRSGSMSGTKFDQSKEALEYIYGNLGSQDRFSLVLFDSSVYDYSTTLLPANEASVSSVVQFIRSLQTQGSTDIHSGVISALDIFKEDGNTVPIIVLLTDGRANTGLYHRSTFRTDVMNQNTVDAAFFNIAVGAGADWTFVEALALENHGRAIWVTEDQDMVYTISDFVDGFASPIVSDLRFDYGPGAYDVHPAEVRAHYDGSEVLVAGRLKDGISSIPMMLNLTAAEGDQTIKGTFPVDVLPVHDFVPRFWAFSRIKDLTDQMKYNGTDDATEEEITRLALEFQFVTDYTSLFVELPDELQERFDNSTGQYPGDVGSSDQYPPSLAYSSISQSAIGPRRTSHQGSGSSSTHSYNDPVATQDSSSSTPTGTTDGTSQSGVQSVPSGAQPDNSAPPPDPTTKSTRGGTSDMDSDGLPNIEETYPTFLKSGDQVTLSSEADTEIGSTQGEILVTEDEASIPWEKLMFPLGVVLIPFATVFVLAIHWFLIGRKRFEKG